MIMATNTIKVKVNGKTYTACFYGHNNEAYDQIKPLKSNDAIDVIYYDDFWSIVFESKTNGNTIEVEFEYDNDGNMTDKPIKAVEMNDDGVIVGEYHLGEVKTWDDVVNVLTDDERQLLADTIIEGEWGDCQIEFANGDGTESVTCDAMGYCTNDAKNAGHFSGRKVSALFRSMYRKLETIHYPHSGMGRITAHCNDWWGDGSGDMMFIRDPFDIEAREWAENYNK